MVEQMDPPSLASIRGWPHSVRGLLLSRSSLQDSLLPKMVPRSPPTLKLAGPQGSCPHRRHAD